MEKEQWEHSFALKILFHYTSKEEKLILGDYRMRERAYQSLIELTNGKRSSIILKKFAQSNLSKKFIPAYIKLYDINLAEVSKKVKEFKNLHDFFTRPLIKEARPIAQGDKVYASPVDARIESFGKIINGIQFTVKEKSYSLIDLLGNAKRAKEYEDGQFIVFYLSPADYHRIHSPIDGRVISQYILGQKSFPVNQTGLKYGKKPISHNYRHITELKVANDAQACVIKVGAMCINSIVLTDLSTQWEKGKEVGYFSFGSTVVMLFEKNSVAFTNNVVQGSSIRMGEAFANML